MMRILTCRFTLLEMIGANSRFLAPLKICQALSDLRNPHRPVLFIFRKSMKNQFFYVPSFDGLVWSSFIVVTTTYTAVIVTSHCLNIFSNSDLNHGF